MAQLGVDIVWLDHGTGIEPPGYQSAGAAGLDIRAAVEEAAPIVIMPGKRALVPTGFAISLPQGFEAQIRPRSGLAAKFGVTCLNTPGTIDSDYRGEIKVLLINLGEESFTVNRGDRIAQMVVMPVSRIAWRVCSRLPESRRGDGGFGSSGRA